MFFEELFTVTANDFYNLFKRTKTHRPEEIFRFLNFKKNKNRSLSADGFKYENKSSRAFLLKKI